MIDFKSMLSGRVYLIPKNQRGYSWTKKEINDLFCDLKLMGNKSHYLGSIICSKNGEPFFDEETNAATVPFILEDGQQRITTFLLIIYSLMKRFLSLDGAPSLDSQELERIIFSNKNGKKVRVENANAELNDCLRHIFLQSPVNLTGDLTPPMVSLINAIQYISSKLSSIQDRSQLVELKNAICQQSLFIDVDLTSAMVDRYLAFDAINSRGLPLTEFDKIKNFCILIAERRGLAIGAEDEWYKAITNLQKFGVGSRSHENAFVAELFSVYHERAVSGSGVHDAFVDIYRELLEETDSEKERKIKGFIEFWAAYSNSYGVINTKNKSLYVSSEISEESYTWLNALDRLGLPGITQKILSASHLRYSKDDFSKVARFCEIYTFRMHALSRYRVDKNSSRILSLSHKVAMDALQVDELLSEIAALIDSDSPVKKSLSKVVTGEINYLNWSYLYYFLYEYERKNSGVDLISWKVSDNDKRKSIEHILPQKPKDGGWWQEHWPEDVSYVESWSHRIGNLVLTQGNAILGRKPLSLKLQDPDSEYFYSCENATNTEKLIANYTNGTMWREGNILKREKDILDFAVKRWTLPSTNDICRIEYPPCYQEFCVGEQFYDVEFDDFFDDDFDDDEAQDVEFE